MIIGSHVSFTDKQLLGSAEEAYSYGANTFMFYTGAPQNTMRKAINPTLTKEAHEFMQSHHINIHNVICHAPYIINLANNLDEHKWEFSKEFLSEELKRCDELGISYLVLHPGSAVGIEKSQALLNISEAITEVIEKNYHCMILLETMAGKGTECGCNLDEMVYLIKHIKGSVGVCLDTCHLNDAGYDMKKFDAFLDLFDSKIGIDKIHCLHLNDSKNVFNSHKDRHANFGYGTLGFDTLIQVCYNKRLENIPKILETPYVGETWEAKEKQYPPYKFEIEMIINKQFDADLLNHILSYYRQ